ncbi:hypothetical protein Q1695_008493 [Nippostrongylus brasiliensis]|nr:hypothetical protein Q1695_008493 [Nippostrongylus brasiliensis]
MKTAPRPFREANTSRSIPCSATQNSPTADTHCITDNTQRTALTCLSMANRTRFGTESDRSSSIERRACRICQSESGEMVRPCGCAGTMGDIHEACLSRWVAMSNKDQCEICQEKYARSGRTIKPLKKWERPRIGAEEILSLVLIGALSYCIIYMIYLCEERMFLERMSMLPIRSDDVGRICEFWNSDVNR